MGYETKLLIAEYNEHQAYLDKRLEEQHRTIFPIATIDLSKCGYHSHTYALLKASRDAQRADAQQDKPQIPTYTYSFYGSDGNTKINDDMYGDRLTAVDLEKLCQAMIDDQIEDGEYRRFSIAIPLLQSFITNAHMWGGLDNLVCVQYGY